MKSSVRCAGGSRGNSASSVMLFNTHVFIFLFLPITAAIFCTLGSGSSHLGAAWLAAASLFFCGWWNPVHVGKLVGSILVNYVAGQGGGG